MRGLERLKPIGPPSKEKHVQGMRPAQPPQCQTCKRYNFGECKIGTVMCFICRELGHIAIHYLTAGTCYMHEYP